MSEHFLVIDQDRDPGAPPMIDFATGHLDDGFPWHRIRRLHRK
ncbi:MULTISPECIES: hypothetical protein [Duganella]|jgi:hypothetical protein